MSKSADLSDLLAEENRQLHAQLEQLLLQANRNQQIWQRHQAFDLQLIAAPGLRELFDQLFRTLPDTAALKVVTLALLDPDYQIRRIMAELEIKQSDYPHLIFAQHEDEFGPLGAQMHAPHLCAYQEALHGWFFPDPIPAPASVALLPLRRKERLIGCLSAGSGDGERFAGGMASDFLAHMASIVAICLENVISNEELQHIGLTDALTGVHNRRYVEGRLLEEIERARRHRHALSCLFIDIDHFKQVNDSAGHQTGDRVLREVAARIKAELRLSDTLGRFGGEEFVVLLTDTEAEDARGVAERIRQSMLEPVLRLEGAGEMPVSVSVGVATLGELATGATTEDTAHALLGRADQALYRAKQGGRNRVECAA